MIWSGVLTKIVCEEYDRNIRRNESLQNKGMKIRLFIEDKGIENSEKDFEILLFGSGYVTVMHRTLPKASRYESIIVKGWIKDSCHDSCWRDDGVESIFNRVLDKKEITYIGDFRGWYSLVELTNKDKYILGHTDPKWEQGNMKDYNYVIKSANSCFNNKE